VKKKRFLPGRKRKSPGYGEYQNQVMAEKFVENQFCRACGADIRQGALFCYGCGSAVAADLGVGAEEAKQDGASNFWFRGEITEGKGENNSPKHRGTIDKPIEKPLENSVAIPVEKNSGSKDKKLVVQEPVKLKTAAAVRQKSRMTEGKKVEVAWEEPDSHANVWFIVVSIILTLFAVGVLLAMLYIR
jgi:hypothetical protein